MEIKTTATQGVQSSAPQELSAPATTSDFNTPTMTFGEVGDTIQSDVRGYDTKMHGVGSFKNIEVLSRMRQLSSGTWTTSEAPQTTTFSVDVVKALCGVSQNAAILNQFNFFRAGIEVTVRLNTNQFYYGALMASLSPMGTGQRMDERAVLSPVRISAQSSEAVVLKHKYCYPFPWMSVVGANASWYPISLFLDVLAPLTQAQANMPSSVSIQVWARFTDIELSYPVTLSETRTTGLLIHNPPVLAIKGKKPKQEDDDFQLIAQAGIPPENKYPAKPDEKFVNDTKGKGITGMKTIDKAIKAVESISIGDVVRGAIEVGSAIADIAGPILSAGFFLLDKPDHTVTPNPMILEGSSDLFVSDIPDSNVNVALYKDRYIDPSPGRMPMSENWTLSKYAQIPGIRQNILQYTAQNQSNQTFLIQLHPNNATMKIPLDYAFICSHQWRGSIKVVLFFFTSSFISARFTAQMNNAINYGATPPTEPDNGMTRIIDVKGDTVDAFVIPWLDDQWWSTRAYPALTLTCTSEIASTDTAQDPTIYVSMWVAGGDDIQFAWPRIPNYPTDWNSLAAAKQLPSIIKGKKPKLPEGKGKERLKAQGSIGEVFKGDFAPFVENLFYDIDQGKCVTDQLCAMTDIAKRYTPFPTNPATNVVLQAGVGSNQLDDWYNNQDTSGTGGASSQEYYNYWQWRNTLFGAMRSAFLFRAGGYRFRYYGAPGSRDVWSVGSDGTQATIYLTPYDGITRLTVPQMTQNPYGALNYFSAILPTTCTTTPTLDATHLQFIAARDDVQFGYPILPTGLAIPVGSTDT